jgi:hypothetical protein
LEKKPRTAHANQRVADILGSPQGLADGFRQIIHRFPDNFYFRFPRLHEKLYFFSHPTPHVLVGSFNPSSNRPEDPSIIAEIGDHDQEHNFLVEIRDNSIVSALRKHAEQIHDGLHCPWERLLPIHNRIIQSGDTSIYTFPRRRRGVLKRYLETVPPGSILRIAASHMNNQQMANLVCSLRKKGVAIEIIGHATLRRVPLWVERKWNEAGIRFHRYQHPRGTSMHNKFILVKSDKSQQVIFGSMNLSSGSLHANHELLVFSRDPCLFDRFCRRWEQMRMDIEQVEGAR